MAANPCCSIEMEPRTLNQGQISLARDVAVDILRKKEPNEASDIFTEGMKPVAAMKEMVQIVQKRDSLHKLVENEDHQKRGSPEKLVESKEKNKITEASCQCSCMPLINESPDQVSLVKEPLSAPF